MWHRHSKGDKQKKGSEKPLPTLSKGKETLWYRVPYNSSTNRIRKRSMGIRRVAGLT
jgi:hypothetical protein